MSAERLVCVCHKDSMNCIINQVFLFKLSVENLEPNLGFIRRKGTVLHGLYFSLRFPTFLVPFSISTLALLFSFQACLFIYFISL